MSPLLDIVMRGSAMRAVILSVVKQKDSKSTDV